MSGSALARARIAASTLVLAALFTAAAAGAQGRRRGRPAPTPTQDEAHDNDESPPPPRTEPEIAPPNDPLAIPPELRPRIGTDYTSGPASPEGPIMQRKVFPYYQENQGDYRLRLLPPFFVEQSRGLRDPTQELYGIPKSEDTQGIYGLLYYRRRSRPIDMDVVFPAFWRVRDGDSHLVVVGPVVHREAPGEHDNWLPPLYFEGERKHGGYFIAPELLTGSQWDEASAFTLVGPYFRARKGTDVNTGLVPFLFHGDNGNIEGARRTYTLIPPLFTYVASHELEGTSITVAGPVVTQSDPKRDVFDILPLYYHIHGKPESGGVIEDHTTLFPFFHYGHDPNKSLLVLPGYYRQVTRTSDTLLSLVYSHIETRRGATTLTAVGPVVPLWWDYRDRDLGVRAWAIAPFYFTSDSPREHAFLTPLVGHFQTYGESQTWWFLPTLTISSNTHGWEDDLHPILYVGRSDDSSHTVVAPVFWDFANAKGRTTIGFPIYWRFADTETSSVTQVAGNTLYEQKRVANGIDWQFHLLPLFSYGESPTGYFWNVLFGLAGFSRDGASAHVRALWIPFDVGGAPPRPRTAAAE